MDFFKNYLSTNAFIVLGYFFYTDILNLVIKIINYFIYYINILTSNIFSSKLLEIGTNHEKFFERSLSSDFIHNLTYTSNDIFQIVIYSYIILLIPYYLIYTNKSKARIIINYIVNLIKSFGKYRINKDEKLAILSWTVKLFFAPLMIFWFSGHIFDLTNNIFRAYNDIPLLTSDFISYFNRHLFYLLFTLILFLDVFFFTMGYLLEAPFLKNKIKSVDPYITGWILALICYPPFTYYLTNIIGWYSKDFPIFDNPIIHVLFNIIILLLMGIYTWASVSLGFKASNLTNRGIVAKGPYKYIRHPAYICKNLAWWIGAVPFLYIAISKGDYNTFFIAILSLSIWTAIYYGRAITEERHLSLDDDYIKYKKDVKYKFIPKIY